MDLRWLLPYRRTPDETDAQHLARLARKGGYGSAQVAAHVIALSARVDDLERRLAALEAR
jgi:hypothetical protein